MNEEFITKLEEVLRNIPIFFNEKGESLDIPIEYFTDAHIMKPVLKKCLEHQDKFKKHYDTEDIESFRIIKDKYGNFYMRVETTKRDTSPLIIPFTNKMIVPGEKAIIVPMSLFMKNLLEELHSNGIEKIQNITSRVEYSFGYENYSEYVNKYWTDLFTIVKDGNENMDAEKFLLVKFERLIKYIEYINKLTTQGTSISCELTNGESSSRLRMPKNDNREKHERKNPIIPPEKRFAFLEREEVEVNNETFSIERQPCKKYPINFDKSVKDQFIAYVYKWDKQDGYLIILEPVSGERSTRFEYISKKEIDEIEGNNGDINKLCIKIIEDNLSGNRKLNVRNHTSMETFVLNILYILQGKDISRDMGACNPSVVRDRLNKFIAELIGTIDKNVYR